MTVEDKSEIKELLHDYISGVMARQDSKFEIIQFKLDYIKEQTTRTNGRVTKIEDTISDLEKHPASCILASKVRIIEDALLSQTSIKRWIAASIALTGGFLGVIAIALQLLGVFK